MTVTVYIWLPKGSQFGHVSMTLENGTHISWWPSSRKSLMKKADGKLSSLANDGQTFEDDKELEEREPEHVFYIRELNEGAILDWWSEFKLGNSYWSALTMNCSTVIFNGLCHGDSNFKKIGVGFRLPCWTPQAIEDLLKKYLHENPSKA